MNRVRKIAASIWEAKRFIEGAKLLCGHDIKVTASGTWNTRNDGTGELVFLTSVPAEVRTTDFYNSDSGRKKFVNAVVDGEVTRIYEGKDSYLYVEFTC